MSDENRKEKFKNHSWPFLLIFFGFTAACIVFSILCIYEIKLALIQEHKGLFIALAVVLLCALCGLCVWFTLMGKDTLTKTMISGYILLFFCLVLVFVLQKTGFFEVIGSKENLQIYLEEAGAWMPIVFVVLQYLQVVILPIPSTVSTLAGLALFGPHKTLLLSLLGILPASATAFFVGRKLGYKAVSWIVGEETLNKWQEKLKGKDNILLTMMFVLPMFPDDILCFIAGLSSMSTTYFFVMILISRLISIAGTCYSFEFIPLNTWWGLLLWGIIIIAIAIAFFLVYKNTDKIQEWIKNRKKSDKIIESAHTDCKQKDETEE